ncbi:MAG: right-handed parallel beta-helix repeat-containing protein [Deltaproteobacteria bacterium]
MSRPHTSIRTLALATAVLMAAPATSEAAFDWNADIAAPSVQASSPLSKAALKCQKRIARETGKYLKRIIKAQAKCWASKKVAPQDCLTAKDEEKLDKAFAKTVELIDKDCAASLVDEGALPNLWTAAPFYGDGEAAASCFLGQAHAIGEVVAGNNQGIVTDLGIDSKDRAKCIRRVSSEGTKVATGTVKTIARCLDKQLKSGSIDDLGPVCFGTVTGGVYTAPSDEKTAEKLLKIFDKAEFKIAKDCDVVETAGLIESLPACSGSQTVADLYSCAIGESYAYGVDVATIAYAESAIVLSPSDSVQAAVDSAAAGSKFLLRKGTYEQATVITSGDLSFVGCGSAEDDRPLFLPPAGGTETNGFNATSPNGQPPLENLVFQSLAFGSDENPWDENGIFISNANNLLIRDIYANGGNVSVYGVYPVRSTNVLLETSDVDNTRDAGHYVGQTVDCEVRFNSALNNPAGIEIENSGYCDVHNNIATGNTAGLLIFKLPGPALQISKHHDIHHNYVADNNVDPNNCHDPTGQAAICAAVPGTGLMLLSDRFSTYRHNVIRDNKTWGFLAIDQETVNVFVAPGSFDPVSDPQALEGHCLRNNSLTNNGYNAHSGAPPGTEGHVLHLPLGARTFSSGWFDNATAQPILGSQPGGLLTTCPDPATLPSAVGAFVDGPILF